MELKIMDHSETLKYEDWKVSRELAEEMFRTIPGLCDNYELDQITLGDGECFHTSIHQQLRRLDVQENLSPKNRQLSRNSDMRAFKSTVRRFMINSKHPIVNNMKEDFEIFMEGTSWDQYWSSKNLLRKEFWADEVFVRATAWFLKLDIVIYQNVHGATEKLISGNIDNENIPCEGPRLHIGYLLNRHYQSILPRNPEVPQNLAYEIPSGVCPVCGKAGKNVLNHIQKSKNCS